MFDICPHIYLLVLVHTTEVVLVFQSYKPLTDQFTDEDHKNKLVSNMFFLKALLLHFLCLVTHKMFIINVKCIVP